ncbi:MAG TPA: 3-deoxy-7-phosphoheptulonate synthase [Kiritimatiellia bacterium]|nr:3-deoxy-7-phosphoheptulonate synthase [Kiritimatiellia bacterium]HNS81097.1 3-deoxy-7-phosphoheptulonate synthase [Kiritimatiellia bacterium]HPA77577.1 3-deoxy-7-phosphoheptulonate synthase [Kiritimatiellia bacterium]HQQ03615.1 3-deoxy-7-phosphoheptulonate synthase [Kiritimatiellia bacterium]
MSDITDDNLEPVPADRMSSTDDQRIENILPLPPPAHLIRFFPIKDTPAEKLIGTTRRRIRSILRGQDDRLLVVIGPCSIHDPASALEYAERLKTEREKRRGELEILMRVYFEKPRTSIGWKGLINDPYIDGSFKINEGLRIARDLLVRINQLGIPAACEFLDVISPQYIGDLVSWGAIGARTTESQVHRELASGLSAVVGFKNGTDGNIKIAVDAILAARERHHFLSVHKSGQVAIVDTCGNSDCHVILRGGRVPNFDPKSVEAACSELRAARLPERIMIDLSHGNSAKDHREQLKVGANVAAQMAGGEMRIMGVIAESNLIEGRQAISAKKRLVYGQSITDPCLGWEDSVQLLGQLADAVRARRKARK